VLALASDALTFVPPGRDPREWLQRVEDALLLAGQDRLVERLCLWIRAAGGKIQCCPAPAARAEGTCGRFFLVGRVNQRYCTPSCASRTSTARARRPLTHG
jgi:hypothetical protein